MELELESGIFAIDFTALIIYGINDEIYNPVLLKEGEDGIK